MKPCIVFDLDDTLFETPDINWANPERGWFTKLANAEIIPHMAFLYQSLDYMINDPLDGRKVTSSTPRDIIFCTARPEFYRNATLKALSKLTGEGVTYLDKRLFMRPYDNDSDLTHKDISTSYESKIYTLEQAKKKGYNPVMAFDNCPSSSLAYVEAGVEVVNNTIIVGEDRERFISRAM